MFQKYIKSYTNNFGEVTDTGNYRPINIISSFIKEQLIYNRLDLFVKKKISCKYQIMWLNVALGKATLPNRLFMTLWRTCTLQLITNK